MVKNFAALLLALLISLPMINSSAQTTITEDEYLQLAKEYCARGNNEKSAAWYKYVLGINPNNKIAQQALAALSNHQNATLQQTPSPEQKNKNITNSSDTSLIKPSVSPTNKPIKRDIQTLYSQAYDAYTNGKEEEAISCYKEILALNPNIPAVLYSIAILLKNRGEFTAALPYYNRLLEIEPTHSDALQGRSHALLALGKYDQAWQDFEHRWTKPRPDSKAFSAYMHTNNNDLTGKTVLLKSEFGFGDTLQFIRYAAQVKSCGAHVIAAVQKQLIPLLSYCPYLDLVIPVDSPAPKHDLETVLMSLPWAFKTTLATIPHTIPYLHADPQLTQLWRDRLANDTHFKIGICWHGNAYTTQNLKKLVDTKSIPLKLLASTLSKLEQVSIYSLQKTSGLDELTALPSDIHIHTFDSDFDTSNGAFMDTAAVMKNLDLIITIDTSIAHLAGGLGIPTWLMLPYASDWRWLVDRADSPWYPCMRLFRQKAVNDWESAVDSLYTALSKEIKNKPSLNNHSHEQDIQKLYSQAYQLYNEGKEAEALALYQEIVKQKPDLVEPLYNCAFITRKMGNIAESIPLYEKVLMLNPSHPHARMGLGQAYLTLENFEKGWDLFEDRCKHPRNDVKKFATYIQNNHNLNGKRLLLKIEWGYGDTFMLLRYAQLLKDRGATIIIEAPKELFPFLSLQKYIDKIFLVNTPPPPFDFSTITLSLPWTFKTTEQTIPQSPYLTADEKLVTSWHEKLKDDTQFKVGIVWRGTNQAYAIPVGQIASLAQLQNISVYSLQRDTTGELTTIPHCSVKTFDASFDKKQGAFMDSAAVMKNLDLVITVDTATAHLAGGLGVPVWTLLSAAPDWRWFTKREDCPWYPSMRLFRQKTLGDWDSVMARVVTELKKRAHQKKATATKQDGSTDINTLFGKGSTLVEQGKVAEALTTFISIEQQHPNCIPVLYNIAGCHRRLGSLENAADYYNKTLTLDQKHTDAAFGLALVRHTQGDMKQGWELFNLWRKDIDTLPKNPTLLVGKKVLIKAEWGLGDMINFIRYAQNLHELGAHVVVQCHKPLVKLLSRCPYINTIIPLGSPLPETDFQLPLLYLPTLFHSTEQTVPNTVPYLYPDQQLVAQWRAKLAQSTTFKVGICWDMGHYDTNLAGWKRAIPLDNWHPLLRTKNVNFYCLQKEQLNQLNSLPTDITVHQFGPDFDTKNGGFMDSAAVMKNLDLVITVDTAIAHLAGALGVPVWVMLPYHTDYRWMRDRTDTPWYPTMKLFRSTTPDEWQPVIEQVTEELKTYAEKYMV